MSNAHVWRTAQDRLRREMSRAQFDTWLRGTALSAAADGSHLLSVRTAFAREMLAQAWQDRIESALAEVTGQRRPLRIVVTGEVEQPSGTASAPGDEVDDDTFEDADSPSQAHSSDRETRPTHLRQPAATRARSHGEATIHSRSLPAARPRPAQATGTTGATGYAMTSLFDTRGDPAEHREVRASQGPQRARRTSPALGRGAADDQRGRETGRYVPPGPELREMPEMRKMPSAADGTRAMEDDDLEESRLPQNGTRPASDDAGSMNSWATPIPTPRFNPRYTFDSFIVGRPNQFAHAASLAVAEAPGHVYNPLFLYGGVGLGKTHLLHAIGHSALSEGLTVLYVTSETFTNEIINAIRYRTTEQFRAKYRSVDVLLVDDIQFIAGKESTEDEFFHTFNSLYEANKQIVMCSDRPPKAIISLEERLRSRFEWGLAADIQPPDHEMRVAILRAKADLMGRHVPDEVITFLAGREQSNIRELEGSFNRVLAISDLQGLPLSIETAKVALQSLTNDTRPRHVSVADVLAAVAEYYRVDAKDLCGKQRDKHIVVPRQVAMYLMRQETEASLLEIGQALGGRDHSTVLHGCEKITREISENSAMRKEVTTIRQQLLG